MSVLGGTAESGSAQTPPHRHLPGNCRISAGEQCPVSPAHPDFLGFTFFCRPFAPLGWRRPAARPAEMPMERTNLTEREHQILELISTGSSTKDIARALEI